MEHIVGFVFGFLLLPVALFFFRALGLYAVVRECETQVFTLFGKVIGTLKRPGLNFPLVEFGPRAILIPLFGKKYVVSTGLRQHYLRSLMVNSSELTNALEIKVFVSGFKRYLLNAKPCK